MRPVVTDDRAGGSFSGASGSTRRSDVDVWIRRTADDGGQRSSPGAGGSGRRPDGVCTGAAPRRRPLHSGLRRHPHGRTGIRFVERSDAGDADLGSAVRTDGCRRPRGGNGREPRPGAAGRCARGGRLIAAARAWRRPCRSRSIAGPLLRSPFHGTANWRRVSRDTSRSFASGSWPAGDSRSTIRPPPRRWRS